MRSEFDHCGASITVRLAGALIALALALLPIGAGADDSRAASLRGEVAKVGELEGRVYASRPEYPIRRLDVGDAINREDKILTTAKASATLVFTDETQLILGPSTSIRVDDYNFGTAEEADAAPSFSFSTSILSGVVRTVTGLIAKRRPRSVLFTTSVATIGVRGTHFTVEVQGTSATVILLAQAVADTANAIEVENQFGKVEIDEAGYGTEIPDAMSPPSPPRKMQVSNNMSRLLRSVNTTRRVKIPRTPGR